MSDESITVTLSGKDTVDWIRSKVRQGTSASETDFIVEGLETLRYEDEELEAWLSDVIVKRYDANKADPGRAISIEQVRNNLDRERRKRLEHAL